MRLVTVLAAMIFAFIAATTTTQAQGRGAGQAKKTTVSAPKAKAQTPKQTAKADTRTARATAKADTRTAKATAKADARTARATTKAETRATKTETKAAKLNAQQQTRFTAVVPAGMTVEQAAAGFKNWGQFIAAVNASANHGVSFEQLKTAMTGIAPGATEPTTTPMSLGQALQSLGVADTTTP